MIKVIGVYKIVNIINNKIYIGSSKNIEKRFYTHKYELKLNNHSNIHLQRAWNKYGEDNFAFEVLEECSLDELYIREQFWIDSLNTCSNGYNICPIAGKPKPQNGINNNLAIIDELIAISIKYDLSNGMTIKDVEMKYNLPNTIVSNIRYLKSWEDCVPELNSKIAKSIRKTSSKIDDNTVTLIKIDMANGINIEDIENKFNISNRAASNIRNLTTFREISYELNEKITSFRTDMGKNKTLKMLRTRSYCEKCGKVIYKTNNRQKYCKKCV